MDDSLNNWQLHTGKYLENKGLENKDLLELFKKYI